MLSFLRFENPMARPPAQRALGLDRVDQEALLGVAVAQFLFRAGVGHLLVDFAPRIGVLEQEFGHYWAVSTSAAPGGIRN